LPIRDGGVYLITGGLSGIGLASAEWLASRAPVRLALTGRTPIPPRESWPSAIEARETAPAPRSTLEALVRIETSGATVETFAADVSDEASMRAVVDAVA